MTIKLLIKDNIELWQSDNFDKVKIKRAHHAHPKLDYIINDSLKPFCII